MSNAKIELANALKLVKDLRVAVKQERLEAKLVRNAQREQKAEAQAAKKIEREQKRIDRIAALEAKLEALRLKAQSPKALRKAAQKASAPKVIQAA